MNERQENNYLSRDEARMMLLEGKVDEWNVYRDEHPDWVPDLSDALNKADFREVELIKVNLAGGKLGFADLTDARLLLANLSDADLGFASLRRARLDGAELTGTELSGADLSEANVVGIVYDRRKMKGKYRGIRVATCYSNPIFKRDAQDQEFIDALQLRWGGTWRQLLFWLWGLIDYGRSLGRVALFALMFALVFANVFAHWPGIIDYSESADTWFTPIYYSIVTYTTLGFGDVRAQTLAGEMLVTIEVVLGYVTLGLLLAILANKVARRS